MPNRQARRAFEACARLPKSHRKARRAFEARVRKHATNHLDPEAAWMAAVLDAMCFPRFVERLINPPQRDIELNWQLIGDAACPTFDLLLELDKKPYPLGFSSLKSLWATT